MNNAAPLSSEAERLALLAATRLLDSEPTPAMNALVGLAARLTGCPAAAINLIDAHRLYALARQGLTQKHLSREGSFCDRALHHGDVLVIEDASQPGANGYHPPSTMPPLWRFYAGAPLVVEGKPLGTLCVMDTQPRVLDADRRQALRELAEVACGLVTAELTAQRFRKQEARVRTASLAGSDWLWETDHEGRIQWVSASLIQHTGLDPMAEIGMQARDFYEPRDDHTRASWERYLAARQRREPFSDAIADRLTPRGRITVSISGSPVFNSRGEFMGYRGASRNITRQLELETRARHQDELLRQAFESFHAGIMISGPDGRILHANRHWRQRTGIHQVAKAPPWPDLLRQMIRQGRYPDAIGREDEFFAWRMDLVNQDAPANIRVGDVIARCRDLRLPDGSIVHFSTDVTDAHQQAELLRASEERWKFALEGAGHGVWDWEIGQPHVFYSTRWKAMLGHDDAEVGDQPSEWMTRVHPDDRDRVVASFTDYCRHGQGIFQAEFRMRHKLGHHVWILSRGKVVSHHEPGRPARVVGTHSDITPLKQAEKALRDQQIAEAASRAKSEFLSRMSHEIRTPLNAVRGFAQLLAQRPAPGAPPEHADYLRQILVSSELLGDLINDVLDLQQIEAGAIAVTLERVPLGDVARQCLAMLAPMARQRDVVLADRLPAPLLVMADRRRLHQALGNLISNAIKYNQAGGSVTVSLAALDGPPAGAVADTTLCIKDQGQGMSPDQLARLFQPFERLGQDTSQIEGTGLGLIITRSLIEAMGGRLDIRSQAGHGTRVYVTLPTAPEDDRSLTPPMSDNIPSAETPPPPAAISQDVQDTPASAPAQGSPCTEAQPLRVMYVEDNRINALLFEEALRPYPELCLEIAEDGQIALSTAREQRPEVLVIDAHLPGMTGFEVLRALRTLPGLEHTPAYMCSADALPEDIARAEEEGFTGYWTKPIDIEAVVSELFRLARQGHAATP